MSRFICLGLLSLLAFIAPFAGCNSGAKLVPISGTVTVAGKPIEGITVTFLSKEESVDGKRVVPYGQTDAEGKFSASISPTQDGAPAGEYTVLFQKLRMPDGSIIPEDQSAVDVGVNQIPDMYMNPSPNSESVTIPEGGSESLSFDLKAKR